MNSEIICIKVLVAQGLVRPNFRKVVAALPAITLCSNMLKYINTCAQKTKVNIGITGWGDIGEFFSISCFP